MWGVHMWLPQIRLFFGGYAHEVELFYSYDTNYYTLRTIVCFLSDNSVLLAERYGNLVSFGKPKTTYKLGKERIS